MHDNGFEGGDNTESSVGEGGSRHGLRVGEEPEQADKEEPAALVRGERSAAVHVPDDGGVVRGGGGVQGEQHDRGHGGSQDVSEGRLGAGQGAQRVPSHPPRHRPASRLRRHRHQRPAPVQQSIAHSPEHSHGQCRRKAPQHSHQGPSRRGQVSCQKVQSRLGQVLQIQNIVISTPQSYTVHNSYYPHPH